MVKACLATRSLTPNSERTYSNSSWSITPSPKKRKHFKNWMENWRILANYQLGPKGWTWTPSICAAIWATWSSPVPQNWTCQRQIAPILSAPQYLCPFLLAVALSSCPQGKVFLRLQPHHEQLLFSSFLPVVLLWTVALHPNPTMQSRKLCLKNQILLSYTNESGGLWFMSSNHYLSFEMWLFVNKHGVACSGK